MDERKALVKRKKEAEETYRCIKSSATKTFAKKLQVLQSTICHHAKKTDYKEVIKPVSHQMSAKTVENEEKVFGLCIYNVTVMQR
ncbi:hypothetical protein TNCV_4668161 [Trichonephila clavipes]|nr:hypothetical protein TNCV_4668161 [Trichonephila clavipes]